MAREKKNKGPTEAGRYRRARRLKAIILGVVGGWEPRSVRYSPGALGDAADARHLDLIRRWLRECDHAGPGVSWELGMEIPDWFY